MPHKVDVESSDESLPQANSNNFRSLICYQSSKERFGASAAAAVNGLASLDELRSLCSLRR
jgi:hypothetical protein